MNYILTQKQIEKIKDIESFLVDANLLMSELTNELSQQELDNMENESLSRNGD